MERMTVRSRNITCRGVCRGWHCGRGGGVIRGDTKYFVCALSTQQSPIQGCRSFDGMRLGERGLETHWFLSAQFVCLQYIVLKLSIFKVLHLFLSFYICLLYFLSVFTCCFTYLYLPAVLQTLHEFTYLYLPAVLQTLHEVTFLYLPAVLQTLHRFTYLYLHDL